MENQIGKELKNHFSSRKRDIRRTIALLLTLSMLLVMLPVMYGAGGLIQPLSGGGSGWEYADIDDIVIKDVELGFGQPTTSGFQNAENIINRTFPHWTWSVLKSVIDNDEIIIDWSDGDNAVAYLFPDGDYDDVMDKLGDPIDDKDKLIAAITSGTPLVKGVTDTALDFGAVIWIMDGTGDYMVFLRLYIAEYKPGGGGAWPPDPDLDVPPINDVNDFIKGLFKFILGRDSDSEGLDYWVNELTSGNVPGRRIGVEFVNSAEFKAMMASLSPEELITTLYRGLLGRDPEPEGFAYWVGEVKRGVSLAGIARTFAEIAEFRALLDSLGIKW